MATRVCIESYLEGTINKGWANPSGPMYQRAIGPTVSEGGRGMRRYAQAVLRPVLLEPQTRRATFVCHQTSLLGDSLQKEDTDRVCDGLRYDS